MFHNLVSVFLALGVALSASGSHAQEFHGTLLKISETGKISIGHRETSIPFSFSNDEGEIVGYSIDLCSRVINAVEKELNNDEGIAVDYVPVTTENRIQYVVDGTVDLECGSTTHTLAREEKVDFSFTTFITGTRLLVKSGAGISEIEDLDGRRVAVPVESTNAKAISDTVTSLGLKTEIIEVGDHQDGFEALKAGEVDAYSTDHVLLHGLISEAQEPGGFEVVGRFLSYDPYALMLRRGDPAFRLIINRTLARLFRSGEIYRIYREWFDPMGVPTNVLLEAAFAIQAIPE